MLNVGLVVWAVSNFVLIFLISILFLNLSLSKSTQSQCHLINEEYTVYLLYG